MAASAAAKRLVVFGGSGFVGGAVAEEALRRGAAVLCLSRTGAPSAGLAQQPWARKAEWAQADALQPDTYRDKLRGADAVVVSIGSPPLPFVDRASQARAFMPRSPFHAPPATSAFASPALTRARAASQLRANGETNAAAARTAKEAGVPQARWLLAALQPQRAAFSPPCSASRP